MTMAYIGVQEWLDMWNSVGQSEVQLEGRCRGIADDQSAMAAMRSEMTEVEAFFDSKRQVPTPSPANATTPQYARVAPTVSLACAPTAVGHWDWYRVEYSYDIKSTAPLVEFGMDYGDGRSYVAYDEASAVRDVYWHKYTSPGSYTATAWVVDSNGLRGQASCVFRWDDVAPVPQGGGGGSDWGGGDLDCEDIGYEIWVGDDDPNGLDGDGDGWGCESW